MKWFRNLAQRIRCKAAAHVKNQHVRFAYYRSWTCEKNWFSHGMTTYMEAWFNCPYCGESYRETWSYPSPFAEWANGGDWKLRDRKGNII